VYLDLESPLDLKKLEDPLTYFAAQKGKLVILDEIQRKPELFPVLRGIIDAGRREGRANGQFLILGSASIDLLKQSSESLAGRIRYLELTSINVLEANTNIDKLWLRGGFPSSYLAQTDVQSTQWREDFVRTYLERDVPMFGPRIPAFTLRKLWTMLGHLQGGMVNAANLAMGLDLSNKTVIRYIDLLCDLLLVRKVQPYHLNLGKRLVKSPKVYVRDSGLLHHLLNIHQLDDLFSNPIIGASWEGFVMENLLSILPISTISSFYRTSAGAEIDLLLELPNRETWAIEIKRSSVPKIEKGFYLACEDIKPSKRFVVYNGIETFPMKNEITAISLPDLMTMLRNI
jgi:predicted AAA+ superfamily ATPase